MYSPNELRSHEAADAALGFRDGDMQNAGARERRAWPLYAVIGGAALISSIVVAVAMRTGAPGPANNLSKAIEPAASGPVALPASTEPRPSVSSTITVVPIDPPSEPDAPGSPGAIPTPADLPLALADARGSSSTRPATPPGVKPSPPRRVSAATNPARSAEPPAAIRSVLKHEPPGDEIMRASSDGRHDKVVALCGAGPVSAEHAPVCFLSACRIGDELRARKLITAVPAASRERLIASCQQLGLDITCEADPMACQH